MSGSARRHWRKNVDAFDAVTLVAFAGLSIWLLVIWPPRTVRHEFGWGRLGPMPGTRCSIWVGSSRLLTT